MNLSLFPASFGPDYASSPGASLREVIDRLGLTQSDLAERTGRPKKTINEIVQGKAAITPETALQFERVLGIAASFWLNLERAYRAALARDAERELLAEHTEWLETLPVKELVKRGWIKPHQDRIELLREILTFFGVAFPTAWQDVWADARKATALRQGAAKSVDFSVVAAWLRQGEIVGRAMTCAPFDQQKFRTALDRLRMSTTLSPEQFCRKMQEECAATGVAVIFVPELPRLRVFGAARWLSSERALIQLSLYYKREDQLWFSFFHEAAHILLHGRRDIFVDFDAGVEDRQEEEANRFASDHLIPPNDYRRFVAQGLFSRTAVLHFARQVGIDPGIVVGRLQHDEAIGFNRLTDFRRKVAWSNKGEVVGTR
jgi:HTH-type transcriptional regulator/antitoxin HigA